MSNNTSVKKQTIKIKESALVDLIDKILDEAVAAKKQEWLNEQADKTSLLESKITKLEKQFKTLSESKK